MTVYCGRRREGRCEVQVLPSAAKGHPLPHMLKHSPDGFEWGYGGSGPADLALSLLTHAVGSEIAERYYQRFKALVVSQLAPDAWELGATDIRGWVADQILACEASYKISPLGRNAQGEVSARVVASARGFTLDAIGVCGPSEKFPDAPALAEARAKRRATRMLRAKIIGILLLEWQGGAGAL